LDHLVAFTATKLHPILLTAFLVDYAQRVLVEGFTLNESFELILSSIAHAALARHSTVVHFYPKTLIVPLPLGLSTINHTAIQAREFIFAHEKLRPWGQKIPICCAICKSPRSWGRPIKENSTIVFWCKTQNANGAKCPGKSRHPKPDGLEPFSRMVGGGR
jgi:hypothetical protein